MEHCWAAATESLSMVESRMGGPVTQGDLITAPWIQSYLNASQGLNKFDGFRGLTTHFGMRYEALGPGIATPKRIEVALRESYVMVGYIVTAGQPGSIVLAYGISDTDLRVMDPFRGYLDVAFTSLDRSSLRLGFYSSSVS
jgi:hypothetical protein